MRLHKVRKKYLKRDSFCNNKNQLSYFLPRQNSSVVSFKFSLADSHQLALQKPSTQRVYLVGKHNTIEMIVFMLNYSCLVAIINLIVRIPILVEKFYSDILLFQQNDVLFLQYPSHKKAQNQIILEHRQQIEYLLVLYHDE